MKIIDDLEIILNELESLDFKETYNIQLKLRLLKTDLEHISDLYNKFNDKMKNYETI